MRVRRRYLVFLLLAAAVGAAVVFPRSTAPASRPTLATGPDEHSAGAERTVRAPEALQARGFPFAADIVPCPQPEFPAPPPTPLHVGDGGAATKAPPPALPVGVMTVIPTHEASGTQAAEDARLLEVQVGRLARRVLKVYEAGDRLLVPLAAWLDMVEVRHAARGPRVSGRLEPAGTSFAVDADSMLARAGRRRLAVEADDIRVIGGEVYASSRLISSLFGVAATLDVENAALVIHDADSLPIARRLRRERLRAIQAGGSTAVPGELIHRGRTEQAPGVVATYEVRATNRSPGPDYDLGLATGIIGGSTVLRAAGTAGGGARMEGSWSRAWPGNRWLTQLRLGDGLGSGPRPQTSRGFLITNAPITRTVLVEDLPFAGTLPPDWSVEAYRAGQLVGFDSVGSSGRYSLTLPVHYGENPVEFVAYGPFGEIRTFERTFRALPSMVPARALEYAVSAGSCGGPRCEAAANLDLRYGASRRLTLQAGMDQAWDGAGRTLAHPYAALIASPANAVGLELEAAADLLTRAGFRLEPSNALRLTADYLAYSRAPVGSPFLPPGTREQWRLYGRASPGRSSSTVFEALAERTLTESGVRDDARVGVVLRVENTILRPYARGERATQPSSSGLRGYAGLEVTALPRPALGAILGGVWMQGQVEAGQGSVTSAAVTLARNLGSAFRVEAGTRWDRSRAEPTFVLSLVSQLRAVRATSLVTASAGESPGVHQSVGGSVAWSSASSRPELSSEPSLDRGGLGGTVFIDLNGDGRRQPEEPPAGATALLIGNRRVIADPDGRFALWGIAPWEELLVSVDTATLASPWWVPAYPAAAVMPRPSLVRNVEVPLLIGGVVEGSLLLEEGASGLMHGPLALELVETGTGARTTVETFSDGTFYHMGLRPGHYTASVADSIVSPLGLRADTVRFEVPLTPDASAPGPSVRDLRIRLAAVEHPLRRAEQGS